MKCQNEMKLEKLITFTKNWAIKKLIKSRLIIILGIKLSRNKTNIYFRNL